MRFLKLLAAAIGAPAAFILLSIFGAWLWLRSGLPMTDGQIALEELRAPVEISFGPHGVPTIEAATDEDAYFALGFIHARDRLWQMEVQRLAGAGRLSEFAGRATLERDMLMRRLGVYRAAVESYAGLAPRTHAALDAYAAGVNAYLADRDGPLPIEFQVLGHEPEPWRPSDSLVWNWLISLQLSGNYDDELTRAVLVQRYPAADVQALYPDDPALGTAELHPEFQDIDFAGMLNVLPPPMNPRSASNQWTLAPKNTQTGSAILANDPHLGLQAPVLWYLARIETPTLSIAGATVPGVPFHLLGHNRDIAWGITATGSDLQDLFVERLDPKDPTRYLTPHGSAPLETRREIIHVKNAEPVELTVLSTRHGPVLFECPEARGPACLVALAFGDLGGNATADGLYRLNRAHKWEEFVAAMERLQASQINVGYADRAGNIGFYAPGRVPIRKAGAGRMPKPGWSGEYDWMGFIPFSELPHAFNPPLGRFINANEPIAGRDYAYLIAAHQEPPYRAERIAEILNEDPGHSVEDAQALQGDVKSVAARRMLPLILEAQLENTRSIELFERLRGWDGIMDRAHPEPLIYSTVLHALGRRLLADELGELAQGYGEPDPRVIERILMTNAVWCDDVTTQERESCAAMLQAAFDDAALELYERHGDEVQSWRWGDAHFAPLRNQVIARVPILSRLFEIGIATSGGDHTVARATSTAWPEIGFENVHGSGLRAIYDLGDLENSRFMIATGQSGNPLSRHYGDLVRPWRDGKYLTFAEEARPRAERLRLVPRPSARTMPASAEFPSQPLPPPPSSARTSAPRS